MTFTDIFIKRPVLASVISLLILLFGLRSFHSLPIRQFPEISNTVITIGTAYPGASAQLIQSFITSPLQKAVASAEGIDYITASSSTGSSTIKAFITLNYDPNKAFTNIMSKVAEIRNTLPEESKEPVITKGTGNNTALMYIGFNSDRLSVEQMTDYAARVIQPNLETLPGVAKIDLFGGSPFAMRIWLDPQKMAAFGISMNDLITTLRQKNFQSAAGKTQGKYIGITVKASTDLHSSEAFKNIVIKSKQDALVRLRDVATVELGAQNYNANVTFNGKPALFAAVRPSPSANPLEVAKAVRGLFPKLKRDLPPGLKAQIVYDGSVYIQSSIDEVIQTLIEATLIVILVIFLFLGSIRSVTIPVLTIPLSLVGVCSLMLAFGYSLNTLTLLAMVLAIGLVVDDAIVVVENIHRHLEKGKTRFEAALHGAREIAWPVVSMTLTLAAVYAPIAFMGGLTGALFTEFAITLACAVIISGFIALTLSPMLCSTLLPELGAESRFAHRLDHYFGRLKDRYHRALHNALEYRLPTLVLIIVIFLSLPALYLFSAKETAPQEDQGFLFSWSQAPKTATLDYLSAFTNTLNKTLSTIPEIQNYFILNGFPESNNAIVGTILKPWSKRKRSATDIQNLFQQAAYQLAGLQTFVQQPAPLPISGDGMPIQFVVTSISDYRLMYPVIEDLIAAAQKSGYFAMIKSGLQFDAPEATVQINRAKAAAVGVSIEAIGQALATALSGSYVNRFSLEGRSYEVIPQLKRQFRLTEEQLKQIYVKTPSGKMLPLSSLVTLTQSNQPSSLTQFQQLNAATIEGIPTVPMGTALGFLEEKAKALFPSGMSYDFAGESRQFVKEGSSLIAIFFFALLVIYLVLAAQFESFRDPFIILVSVPISICGALLPLFFGIATVNLYTQIGCITLIGLISKHGILMVDFANQLREEGLDPRTAIEQAAATRLRPILMTTAAMIFGVLPLLLASGAGSVARMNMGLVISAGMAIGTLFTLFVVPTMYCYVTKKVNS